MRVLQIYKDFYPPVIGGIEGHINILCRGLSDRGVHCTVLVSNTRAKLSRCIFNGIEIVKVPEFGRIASAPINPTLPFWILKLSRNADVLHFHIPNPTATLAYTLSLVDKPVIVTYHSDIVRQKRLNLLYTPFQSLFLKKTDSIIATSPNYLKTSPVLSRFREKCRTIPLGIDLSRFFNNKNSHNVIRSIYDRYGKRIILFIGRFRYYKGIEVLIRAMKTTDATLLIIGKGSLERKLKNLVIHENLSRKVIFLGELKDKEIDIYLKACSVFVLPSILRSEAFGVVLLEAMASGKPVISTELGTGTSYINVHNETGLTVPPNDPEALSHSIRSLLDDSTRRRALGMQAKERVRLFFSEDKMVEDIIGEYKRVIKKHS